MTRSSLSLCTGLRPLCSWFGLCCQGKMRREERGKRKRSSVKSRVWCSDVTFSSCGNMVRNEKRGFQLLTLTSWRYDRRDSTTPEQVAVGTSVFRINSCIRRVTRYTLGMLGWGEGGNNCSNRTIHFRRSLNAAFWTTSLGSVQKAPRQSNIWLECEWAW